MNQDNSENQRLLMAAALSLAVMMIWQYFFTPPPQELPKSSVDSATHNEMLLNKEPEELGADALVREIDRQMNQRVLIKGGPITGSINLKGAKIDDISLAKYEQTQEEDSEKVRLLWPSNFADSYFVHFGWLSEDVKDLPNKSTLWKASKNTLEAGGDPVTLKWNNSDGIKFFIDISLDDAYMLSVDQRITNATGKEIELSNFSAIMKKSNSSGEEMIIHKGGVGSFESKLKEIEYDDIIKEKVIKFKDLNGWIGFTDKYWLTALIHSDDKKYNSEFVYTKKNGMDFFQADTLSPNYKIKPSQTYSTNTMLFIGAKELDLLDRYSEQYNVHFLDRSVDFGVLYFITKPIFKFLHYCYEVSGNFGVAILLLTVIIKILLFPLAYKGFRSMNKLKEFQPYIDELRKKHKDEPQVLQKKMMLFYKEKKVNPISGCLPLILQMPIFFALYKVLYVSIEMRHAPFFGWICDLSARDPTSIFNLFGLIPWDPPQFLLIGVLPIFMALTMFLQQRLSPAPSDPMQAQFMKFLPLIFLFMFSSFPSGLVLYWSWSNILSITQQTLIKKISK